MRSNPAESVLQSPFGYFSPSEQRNLVSIHVGPNGDSKDESHNAIIVNIRIKPIPEIMYRGRLPNSSLNDAETRGTVPNHSEYTLKPVITWSREQSRSRIMDETPIV